jgi:hypothetical protein
MLFKHRKIDVGRKKRTGAGQRQSRDPFFLVYTGAGFQNP